MPVIHALPRIAGTIAGCSPAVVSATIRPSNVEPIADAWVMASPTLIKPRLYKTAIRAERPVPVAEDRKSTRLNSSHLGISYAVFCLTTATPPTATYTLPLHDALPISRAAADRRHDRRLLPRGRLRHDPPVERGADRGRVGHGVAHPHQTAPI